MKKRTDLPRFLFHQGTNTHAYEYLGCHVKRAASYSTYTFRVWAPGATSVFVVGDFFGWEEGRPMSRIPESGIWELSFRTARDLAGSRYKYRIESQSRVSLKGDPYATMSEGGARGASVILPPSDFVWEDEAWLRHRKSAVSPNEGHYLPSPMNIYEVHLGSFRRHPDGSYYTYREAADAIASYAKEMGYTHVELLPIMEHPFDGSWGYQVCGFFAPTSRFGTPDDFRYFVNRMHTAGLGVILDWVPAHFPKDEWGLYEFDGGPLYEYQGRDRQESRSWGTRFFDVGREEVQSFLVSSALYWLREFHADGLRVDAVASMLYLDFDKLPGEWNPNPDGSNYCKEAIAFFRKLNSFILNEIPDALMIAEESTDWPGVTRPVSGSETALGFSLKWNMGFANDLYRYLGTDPVFRSHHHTALNFPILYAFRENYILPVSHDEVVHGKLTLLDKCYGTGEDKFLQMRAALLLLMTYPGKKMLFMGTEYAPYREWDYENELEWFMTDYPLHAAMREYVAALNRFYLEQNALWELDFEEEGFRWILADDAQRNLVAYRRIGISGDEVVVAVSFSGGPNYGVELPVEEGEWEVVFATGEAAPEMRQASRNGKTVLILDLPRFGGAVMKRRRDTVTVG